MGVSSRLREAAELAGGGILLSARGGQWSWYRPEYGIFADVAIRTLRTCATLRTDVNILSVYTGVSRAYRVGYSSGFSGICVEDS